MVGRQGTGKDHRQVDEIEGRGCGRCGETENGESIGAKKESVVCKQWGSTGKEDECNWWDGECIVKSKKGL